MEIVIAFIVSSIGLIFWPIFRYIKSPENKWVKRLKVIFIVTLIFIVAAFSIVGYSYSTGYEWVHALIYPYAVGILSFTVSFLLVLVSLKDEFK